MKASFKIESVEGSKYFLKNQNDGKVYEVILQCKEEGKAEFEGLPN